MCSPVPDRVQCALIVQRLMDADVLLPEEGNALLARIEAWSPPTDSTSAHGTRADRFAQSLGAILQTDRLDASARQAALETLRSFIQQPTDPTAPEAQPDQSRD